MELLVVHLYYLDENSGGGM